MQAHQLKPPRGAKHARKRIGRGNAAGQGTYSGRGLKGQKSRAGNKPRRFFEGGQTRLIKKLPFRRGFRNPFRVEYQAVNLDDLQRFEAGTEVTPELLQEKGVLRSLRKPVKILAAGELTKKLSVSAHRFSVTAKEKIEGAGGTVVELGERKVKRQRDDARKSQGAAKEQTEAADETVVEADSDVSDVEGESDGSGG
jgi:large subunit ribosomal protein L15